jgi:hypothetical protein
LNSSTTYHSQTNGKIERTNQILEDMLRMYVMDRYGKWEKYIYLVEFSYNNHYQASTNLSPFEILYSRKCNTPVSWSNPVNRLMIGPNMLNYMELTMKQVQQNLKVAQDRKKSYADAKRNPIEFNVGDHLYIRVKPKKSSLRLGMYTKLAPRYFSPFEIISRIGPTTYQLALPSMVKVHYCFTFHY